MSGKVLIVDSGSEALRFLVAKVKELESDLASERESRKQAEDKAFNAGIEAAVYQWRNYHREEKYDNAGQAMLAQSKPVQEPAERERGK